MTQTQNMENTAEAGIHVTSSTKDGRMGGSESVGNEHVFITGHITFEMNSVNEYFNESTTTVKLRK